jgi:hypothetical protein
MGQKPSSDTDDDKRKNKAEELARRRNPNLSQVATAHYHVPRSLFLFRHRHNAVS